MICPYCGKENPDDLVVCNFCGAPLFAAAGQPAESAHAAQPPSEILQPMADASTPPEQVDPAPTSYSAPQLTPVQTPPPPTGVIYGSRVWWVAGCLVFVCLFLGCIAAALAAYRYINVSKLFSTAVPTLSQPISQPQSQLPTATAPREISIASGATPSSSAQPPTRLLYFDGFSDPSSGWDQVDDADYTTDYHSGAYRIVVKTEMSDSWANPAGLSFEDVVIEVEAAKNGGPDDNDFGLICRYQDTTHFYYGIISSDGYYGITKVSSDSSVILGGDNLEYSDVINQGSAANHIRFDCVGEELTLYVNGQLLDHQTDREYSSGNVGLIAGTYSTPGADIIFDDFMVSAP